jgi:ribosomal protein L7/L12
MAEFGQQFYDEEEAEQILRLAASLTSPAGAMTRERLLATAAELGITAEAVEMAERQIAKQREANADRAEFDLVQRREFYGHLLTYVLVNGFLVVVNLVTSSAYFWALWPILGWGLGLAFHFVETFCKNSESYQEEFEKWQAKRLRRAERRTPDHRVVGNSEFVIDKYVHRRLDRGRDVSKLEAIRYLRDKTDLDLGDAREAVEKYSARNPGVMD